MAYEEPEHEPGVPSASSLETILGSTSLKIAVVGVLAWMLAVLLNVVGLTTTWGVWAAVLAIWGTALIFVGVVAYAVVWWSYR